MVLLELQALTVHADEDAKWYSCSSVIDLDCVSQWSSIGDC